VLRTLLKWEFSSLVRLKIILPLIAFMSFTSYLAGEPFGASGFSGVRVPMGSIAGVVSGRALLSLGGIYLALAFFSSILISTSITGEMDTGILKCYISLPVSRLEVFLAKVLANYLLLLSAGLAAVYYRMVMMVPQVFPILLLKAPASILKPGRFLALELLFTFSVALYFSVVSRKAWHASLYSLLVLYLFSTTRYVAPGLQWYLPPICFTFESLYATSGVFFTAFSIILILLSTYIFTKRLEVT